MKISLLLAASFLSLTLFAQDPIFDPGMAISAIGIVSSPVGEEVDKVIDGTSTTKFLDFELGDGQGFTVDLGGASRTAFSMDITTANDFPVRDPIDFQILGSNTGTSFTTIASGTIDCIPDRFFTRSYTFSNATAYSFYQINFTAPCDPSGGTGFPSMQVAEVQLFEEILDLTDDVLSEQTLSVYPNPASGVFTMEYTGNERLVGAELININGKLVQQYDLTDMKVSKALDIQTLTPGVYFLRVHSESGSLTKKLIIR